MKKDIEDIKKAIFDCINNWIAKASGNPFSWVDDGLSSWNYDMYYKIHWAWVEAWNNSNREKPMEIFLREWATEDNIRKALAREDFSLVPGTYIPDPDTGKLVLEK